jgi:hypothetical protein
MRLGFRDVSVFPCRRTFRVSRHLQATSISTTRALQLNASHGLLKKMSQDPVIVNKVDLPIDEAR